MSHAHNRSFDLQSNYFEVTIEPQEGNTGPSQTFIARVPKGSTPNPETWPPDTTLIELIPLTPTELADFLGVRLSKVEEWIRAREVTTVDYNGATRIPFWEYERRAKGARGLRELQKWREMRVSFTALVHEGRVVENGYRNGHPVFATHEQAALKK
jgi:hypothetical protein